MVSDDGSELTQPLVLVVDDDALYLSLVSAQLSARGYAVATHTTGAGAWSFVRQHPGLRGAVLDANIEGDGVVLAGQLLEARPDLAVVVVSGHSRVELRERGLSATVRSVQKPVVSAELIRQLQAAGLPVGATP